MPIGFKHNKDGVMTEYYCPHFYSACLTQDEQLRLETLKKEYARFIDDLNKFKKDCEKSRDIEGSRFFRQEIADATKIHRAVKLVLGWYGIVDLKDCPEVNQALWPVDLSRELDYVLGVVC